jgi:hypothetical protein
LVIHINSQNEYDEWGILGLKKGLKGLAIKRVIRKNILIDKQLEHPFGEQYFNKTRAIVIGSLLACLTTILQAAGIFGGIGFLISALSTLPILLGSILYFRMGILSYIAAFLLISLIQPSEFFIFPFTTGLLGISLGFSLRSFKKGIFVTLFSGAALTIGILVILYIIQFPVLGPSVTSNINITTIALILIFSTFYSWIWLKLSIFIIKKANKLWSKFI